MCFWFIILGVIGEYMTEKALKINIPSDLFIALNKSEEELKNEMRIISAMKFYETGKLTLGKAAQFAGLSRWDFENLLADNHIPISTLEIQDIENDLVKMKSI
jgi:predicted HTH domain antitoxin